MVPNNTQLTLYSSQASDCSARLRIALNLKGIPYTLKPIHLASNEHLTPEYAVLNPAQTVPTLVVEQDGVSLMPWTQSIAMLEYLEEAYPNTPPLLPPATNPAARARVRTLVDIIGTDIHPFTTNRVGRALAELLRNGPAPIAAAYGKREWDAKWMESGLQKYEDTVKETAGKYSLGDTVTMADAVLVPQLWSAARAGVIISKFKNVSRVFQNLMELEEIAKEQSKLERDASGQKLGYDPVWRTD